MNSLSCFLLTERDPLCLGVGYCLQTLYNTVDGMGLDKL